MDEWMDGCVCVYIYIDGCDDDVLLFDGIEAKAEAKFESA